MIMTENLANPKNTIEIIKKHDFTFQKRYGQNFLIDERVPEKIIAASRIGKEDCVLEIGPGIGTLTRLMAEKAGFVVAVEIDRMLIPILEETLEGFDNVAVIQNDILKCDLQAIADEYNGGRPMKVVANLPYYITTPVVMALLESRAPLSTVTVMVQKEVADRMKASPGTKDYGALSLAVQYHSRPQIVAEVPPNCFIPRPKVGSAVVSLEIDDTHRLPEKEEEQLFKLIKAAFGQRRKTLANAAGNNAAVPYSREETANALESLGLDRNVRGEALGLEQFIALSAALAEGKGNSSGN